MSDTPEYRVLPEPGILKFLRHVVKWGGEVDGVVYGPGEYTIPDHLKPPRVKKLKPVGVETRVETKVETEPLVRPMRVLPPRISNNGYRIITDENEFSRYKGARRAEHIVVAERALGKNLPLDAVVHQHNRDRLDNTPSNLVICPNAAYHALLHTRMKNLELYGNANGPPKDGPKPSKEQEQYEFIMQGGNRVVV